MTAGDHPHLGDIELAENTIAAEWVTEAITDFAVNVGSIIPRGFECYVRIVHPAYRGQGPEYEPVSWKEIAEANGRVMHAEAQFEAISGVDPWKERQPGLWDHAPEEGELPSELGAPLVDVLRKHTSTPDRCWFCVWEGWGGLRIPSTHHLRVRLPHRDYLLVHGRITAIFGSFEKLYGPGPDAARGIATREGATPTINWDEISFGDDGASLWWPDDRAWCVATEIDFMWTYVGGSTALVEEILARPEFEALPTAIEHGVTIDSDPVNPPPRERP
jgi:hypothetical protein